MGTFTRLPWSKEWIRGAINYVLKHVPIESFMDEEAVEKMDTDFDRPGRADVNLIAAAPCLLSALELAENLLKEQLGDIYEADDYDDIMETRTIIRNAIKMARE